jgi:diguanylate cyclase (GGDEF)-like protein
LNSGLANIEAELTRPFHRLRFSERLEARFEADTQSSRNQFLRFYLLLRGLLLLLAFVMHGALALPMTPKLVALTIAPGLFTLACAGLVRRGFPVWLQGCAVVVPSLVDTCTGAMLGVMTPPPDTDRVILSVGFLIFVVVAIVPLRFRDALVFATLAPAAHALVLSGLIAPAPSGQGLNIVCVSVIACIALGLAWRQELVWRRSWLLKAQAALLIERFSVLSNTDQLTGVSNRRFMDQAIAEAWAAAPGARDWVSLVMIDIDHFKTFNDLRGHGVGDECLVAVAQCLQANLRDGEQLARYGGEEFVVVLPGIAPSDAIAVGERLRRAVEALALAHPVEASVTVSVGVAAARAAGAAPADVLRAADEALYKAKKKGRNRTVFAGADEPLRDAAA